MQNTLHVENHLLEPVDLELRLEFDFDFLDLFEVKAREYRQEDLVFTDRTQPRIGVEERRDERENSWSFALHDGGFRAEALVWVSRRGDVEQRAITHRLTLAPGESWDSRANVVLLHGSDRRLPRYTSFYFGQERVRVAESLRAFRLRAPEMTTDWEDLRNAYQRSLADLAALRMRPRQGSVQLRDLPAAGLPWFMTVFGRDTLITELPDAAAGPVAGGGDAGGAGRAAGRRARRRARRRAGQDRARAAGRPGGRRGRVVPLLRQRRCHPAVPDPAVGAVPLDRRHRHGQPDARAGVAGGDAGCASRETSTATASSSTTAAPARASSRSRGRTPGTRCGSATAPSPARRSPPPRCRATPTTPACAWPSWRARCGTTPGWPTRSSGRRPSSSSDSTAPSTVATARATSCSASTTRSARSTRWPRTSAICCGAASSTSRGPSWWPSS